VSSILDALQKVEAAAPRRTLELGALPPPRHRTRRTALAVAGAFAAGALAAVAAAVFLPRRSAPPAEPARPVAAAPPGLPVVPPVPAPAETTSERPWAQVDAPPVAPAAPVVAAREAPPPAATEGPTPHVHVSFLLYSKAPERRSVSLAIEDGGLVTLHEGEQAGGVEVARILPDRVELRYDGRTFTVRAQD